MKQKVKIQQNCSAGLLHHTSNLYAALRYIDHDRQTLIHPTFNLTHSHNVPANNPIHNCDLTDYYDMKRITRTDADGVETPIELAPVKTKPDVTYIADNGLTRLSSQLKDTIKVNASMFKYNVPLTKELQDLCDMVKNTHGIYNCLHLRCRDGLFAKNCKDFYKIKTVLMRNNVSTDIPLYIMTDVPNFKNLEKIRQLGYEILTYDMFDKFIKIKKTDNYKLFAIEHYGVMKSAQQQISKQQFHPSYFKS